MRVTLVIHGMGSGGAERVAATMANAWTARGWEITLITFEDAASGSFYPLDARVRFQPLGIAGASRNLSQAIISNSRRLLAIRRTIQAARPDVVVTFLDMVNVRTLLALAGTRVPVVVTEQTDPGQKNLGRVWETLRRWTYRHAARVVVLGQSSWEYFPPDIRARTVILPNPIAVDQPDEDDERPSTGQKTLVAVGRLVPEKGFDLLLEAFARVAPEHPNWRLVIWGEGPLRRDLEAQRDRLGLRSRVSLPGRTQALFRELRRADLFVMSSRREGLPMALGEAMACGLPAVSFDCRSGPREIIRPGVDGLLVPPGDIEGLAAALSALMGDDAERQRMAQRAPEVLERFSAERVLDRWEELLETVIHERAGSRQIGTLVPGRTAEKTGSRG